MLLMDGGGGVDVNDALVVVVADRSVVLIRSDTVY